MGKGGDKPQYASYRMSLLYGVCHGVVDSFNGIWIKGKLAWCGTKTVNEDETVVRDKLFGGKKKEGGINGKLGFYRGTADQLLRNPFAERFDLPPEDLPGYRGIAMLACFGNAGRAGFVWSHNNPFLPPVEVSVTRLPRPAGLGMDDFAAINTAILQGSTVLNLPEAATAFVPALAGGEPFASPTVADVSADADEIDAGDVRLEVAVEVDFTEAEGGFELFGHPVQPAEPLLGDYKLVVEFLDGTDTLISGETQTVTGTQVANATARVDVTVPASTRSIRYYFIYAHPAAGNDPSDPATGSLLDAILKPAPGKVRAQSVKLFGASLESAGEVTETPAHCEEGGSFAGLPDANPAHMVYECLTDPTWGMGAPDSAINLASFREAAVRLYNEGLGLSMMWARQSTIEEFVSEILDHIQGTLFIHPAYGQWVLTLIRGDYDRSALRSINPGNAVVKNRQREAAGEVINEVVTTYTDPDSEKEATVVIQDLGSISQTGRIISDSRDYYGCRSSQLAARLGARDLRAASSALFSASVEAGRDFWNLLPGEVLMLDWPEDGIQGMAVRVASVDYGSPKKRTISFEITEDIFGREETTFTAVQDAQGQPTEPGPAALTNERAITLPLSLATLAGVDSPDASDSDAPDVGVLLLGDHATLNVTEIEVFGETTNLVGGAVTESIGYVPPTSVGLLSGALTREVASVIPGTDLDPLGDRDQGDTDPVLPGDIFYIDGGDAEGEFIITESKSAGDWTVLRGMFDTVPKDWPGGSVIWWIGPSPNAVDPITRAAGVETTYRLAPEYLGGAMESFQVPPLTFTPTPRRYAPTRPAGVRPAGGNYFASLSYERGIDLPATLNVEWAHRDRTMEDSAPPRWDDAGVTPEAGQTVTIKARQTASGAVEAEWTGLTGTSYAVPITDLVSARDYRLEVYAERNGWESVQADYMALEIRGQGGWGYAWGLSWGGI